MKITKKETNKNYNKLLNDVYNDTSFEFVKSSDVFGKRMRYGIKRTLQQLHRVSGAVSTECFIELGKFEVSERTKHSIVKEVRWLGPPPDEALRIAVKNWVNEKTKESKFKKLSEKQKSTQLEIDLTNCDVDDNSDNLYLSSNNPDALETDTTNQNSDEIVESVAFTSNPVTENCNEPVNYIDYQILAYQAMMDNNATLKSIAESLKRIADCAESNVKKKVKL